MVPGLRTLLVALAILWLFFQQCYALKNSLLRWRLDGENELMECESLNISLSPETNNTLQRNTSYYLLAFEPGGNAMMSSVGSEPSALRWRIQHPAGTQLFLALLDPLATFLGVHSDMYTVIPGSKDCMTRSEAPGILETTEPKITPSHFGHLVLCGPWEIAFARGKLPNSVSKFGSFYDYSVPSRECILPYTGRGGGQLTVIISDANSMGSIIHIADAKDTPSGAVSEAFSRCRQLEQIDMLFRLRGPPRPTVSRLRRSLSDHLHLQLSLDSVTMNSSYGHAIAVIVCVSLGGTGIVAMATHVIMLYRRRKKILGAQDTLPRPFEITVPAATTTGASTITHDLTSVPTLKISPPRVYSQSRRKGTYEARREESLMRVRCHTVGSAPIPTTTTPSQSQPRSSRDTGMQSHLKPHPSDASLLSNRAGLSSCHTSPRPSTHPHAPTPPDPQLQSSSCLQLGRSPTSPPPVTQPQRPPVNRSVSLQERRSAKYALWLSHSASELYRATSAIPRYRLPGYGSHAPSGRQAHLYGVDTFSRSTNYLRQWHLLSPVAHVRHGCSDSDLEEDTGAATIFQHEDAGVMQELPPPYHKLVRSGEM